MYKFYMYIDRIKHTIIVHTEVPYVLDVGHLYNL